MVKFIQAACCKIDTSSPEIYHHIHLKPNKRDCAAQTFHHLVSLPSDSFVTKFPRHILTSYFSPGQGNTNLLLLFTSTYLNSNMRL
jgi:hypothetical protein